MRRRRAVALSAFVLLLHFWLNACSATLASLEGWMEQPDTQTAAGRSHASCAFLLATVRWPGGRWTAHPSGDCNGLLPKYQ